MSILIKTSNHEFLDIYGDHPYVSGFSREVQDEILNQLSVLQRNCNDIDDMPTWKDIFTASATIDAVTMLEMYESYLYSYTYEIVKASRDINRETVQELIKELPNLENDELLKKYINLIDKEPQFMDCVLAIVAKHGQQVRLSNGRYLSTTTSLPDE